MFSETGNLIKLRLFYMDIQTHGNTGSICSAATKNKMRLSAIKSHAEGKHGGFKKGHVSYVGKKENHYSWIERVPFICPQCGITKMVTPRQAASMKYCGQKCFNTAGLSDEHKQHIGNAVKGPLNGHWKGANVGYFGLHRWIHRIKGIPTHCRFCESIDNSKKYCYANVDHEYKRTPEDFIESCYSCHRKYDILCNPKQLTT